MEAMRLGSLVVFGLIEAVSIPSLADVYLIEVDT